MIYLIKAHQTQKNTYISPISTISCPFLWPSARAKFFTAGEASLKIQPDCPLPDPPMGIITFP